MVGRILKEDAYLFWLESNKLFCILHKESKDLRTEN